MARSCTSDPMMYVRNRGAFTVPTGPLKGAQPLRRLPSSSIWRAGVMSLLIGASLGADPVRPEAGPWIPDLFVWRLDAQGWTGSYRWCEGSCPQTLSILAVGGGFALSESTDAQARISIAKCPGVGWDWDVVQLYGRTLLMDEYDGYPFTAAVGIPVTFGSSRAVHEPAEFVPSNVNGELQLSAGKEWSRLENWWLRTAVLAAAGLANEGGPWFRGWAEIALQVQGRHALGFMLEGIRTLGSGSAFERLTAQSYARRRAQWLDGWLTYRYQHPVYGSLALQWQHRFKAQGAPRILNLGNVCVTYTMSL